VRYSFHPDAKTELLDAINYYEACQSGLGQDFAYEVYAALERITVYPRAWSVIEDDIRRSLIKRFPYGILYTEENAEIFILAVMHLHKNPDYWKYRM
jgi:plasmid stabilization system protein ParE